MSSNRQSIFLITYNIHKGFGVGKLRFLLPQMRAALSGLNPDFVFLQEVQGLHRKREQRIEHWPDLPQFEYMADRDWPHYLYAKNAVYQDGHHGNAILSKYSFDGFENINLALHQRASRSILHAKVQVGPDDNRQTLHLLCVHLGLFRRERALQFQALLTQVREAVPVHEPLIMAGDFNDWRIDFSLPLARELGIREAFFSMKGQHARSFPALKPALCIDRIYYRGLEVREAICLNGKPWRTLSDHLPLCARFDLL